MGLGYKPIVQVTSESKQLANIINQRLISWKRTDAPGIQTDQITLVIDTQNQDGLPKEGAILNWHEGVDDTLIDRGVFKITRITPVLFPPTMTIVATAAPFQVEDNTRFKERQTKTFENITLADLFRQVVTAHGFSPRVATEYEDELIEHLDQTDETDVAFLTRLARERDAIAKPVNDLYVLSPKGREKTLSGQRLPTVTLSMPSKNTPSDSGFINCQLEQSSRSSVNGIKANWTDSETGEEHTISTGSAPFKKLRQAYSSQGTATKAVQDELLKTQRKQGAKLTLEVPGNIPDSHALVVGAQLILDGSFPAMLSGGWRIESVTASGNKQGYRVLVRASVTK